MELDEYLSKQLKKEWVLEFGAGKSTEVLSRFYNVVTVDKNETKVPDGVIFIEGDAATSEIYSRLKGYDFKAIIFDLGVERQEKALNIATYYLLKLYEIIKPHTLLILDNMDWEWMKRMKELLESEGYKIINDGDRQCTMGR